MARTKTWKHTERHVAKALNGQRVGNRGTNTEDVSHEWLSIECKHRESLPSWLKLAMWQAKTNACADKLPVVVLHESGQRHADNLVIIRMADFQEWFGGNADSEAGQLYAEGCAP